MTIDQHEFYTDKSQIELVPGTLRGYRVWGHYAGHLTSTGWNYPWAPCPEQQGAICARIGLEMYARALHNAYDCGAPLARCSCGYYASYDPASNVAHAQIRDITSGDWVRGAISAYGRIVLGTGGFRAQRVRIDAVWGPGPVTRRAAKVHGVPWFRTRKAMLEQFPPSDVTELLR